MKRFTRLYLELDQTNKTLKKVDAIERYFRDADPQDAAWALYFLSGQKVRQLIPTKLLRQWAAAASGVEMWLFEECHDVVGDLAETMALMLPDVATSSDVSLARWMETLLPLRESTLEEQRQTLLDAWQELDASQRFVLHKIITGSFRVGVSQGLLVRGLAQATGIDAETLSHRLMGHWEPTGEAFLQLCDPDDTDAQISRPYPFFLAHPLEELPEIGLGDVDQWQAEWKWDGIRAAVIRRAGQVFIWSRGEELITERFPEVADAADTLPSGTVLDGELVGWTAEGVLPFGDLQRRIGRKNLTKRILQEVPVAFIAFDCLESEGQDIRPLPLVERRKHLEGLLLAEDGALRDPRLRLSPIHAVSDWDSLKQLRAVSREHHAEGLMLKRGVSPYRVGRPRGDWWKWKIEPYTIDAVLIYAQRGHGKRASLYTDYTFAVWDQERLVPFAKAYSGLTDEEIRRVDHFVRRNTLEKFGPVRSVKPELVFELAFEDIRISSRHKSGIAIRFPRIARWRTDKSIEDADSLAAIQSLLQSGVG
ncbi:MAG: ATP-dependent DNA ligase [Planctomycetaceae bacterium]